MFEQRIHTQIGCTLLLFAALGASLTADSATPHAAAGRKLHSVRAASRVNLPSRRFALAGVLEKRLPPLAADELAPSPDSLAVKVGVHRRLGADLDQFGVWNVTPEGKHLWRLAIRSPEASGVRFHIRGFHAGAGRLWLHDGSGRDSEIMGPYSGDGPFGDGEFWTDFVLSETAVLEFQRDEEPASARELPFEIVEISHIGPLALASAEGPRNVANCHLDVTCYQEWAFTARSVGHIVYEELGGAFVCSGTLLATQQHSGIPYFLTADHCISNDTVARTMQVFWMYQSSTCNGAPPANKLDLQRSLGARYLTGAGLALGDFTLVRLNSVPDSVVYSGWDTTEPEIGAPLTGIHHPGGDYKRISFGRRAPAQRGLSGTDPDYYYSIAYADGRTEGGSSGSGLFVRPGVLVGSLTWGPKQEGPNWVCQFQPEYTGYGRFSTHYPRLRQYLADAAAPAPDPPPSQGGAELESGRGVQVSLPAAPTPVLHNGYFIRVPEGAASLRITVSVNADAGLAVSAGEPPKVVDGRVSAAYYSQGTTGRETLVLNRECTPPLQAGVYYIALANFTVNQAAAGTLVASIETSGQNPNPPSGEGRLLTSGVPASFSFAPVQGPALMNGARGFRIQVPSGATRLEIRLSTSTPGADLDLYARSGADIELRGSELIADHVSDSPSGEETIVITPQSSPALQAGVYYIGLGIFARDVVTAGVVTATVTTGGATPPPPAGSTVLTSGVPTRFDIAAVNSATLLNGARGFTIQVPEGATRLDIRLNTSPSSVDVDLYARFGEDVVLDSRTVMSDYDSSGPDGSESISITAQSNPPLRPGTYFIAFGVFTANTPAVATITATVTGGSTPPPGGTRVLTSGKPATFFTNPYPSQTLLNGPQGYMIQVPQGASRLEIKLNMNPSDFDMDLFVRAGADPVLDGNTVIADFGSTGPDGTETIVITTSTNPPLKPGTYYIALGIFTTNRPASGTLLATVITAEGNPETNALRSGVPARFSFQSVDVPTLRRGQAGFYIDVPEGVSRLDVRLDTETAGADLDLYVRQAQDIGLENGYVVADFSSEGPTGSEEISISGTSTPPLRPGRYFVGLVIFSTGVPSSGTVTATFKETVNPPSGGLDRVLTAEAPARLSLPAAPEPYLFAGPNSYKLSVPEGVTGVRLDLRTEHQAADVDLYVRYRENVELNGGRIIADYAAVSETGDESLVINGKSSPALRPGDYYIAFANLTPNAEARASLAVTFDRSVAPPQSSPQLLEPGRLARFQLTQVTVPTLFQGDSAFRVVVPPGTGRLAIRLWADTAAHNVDLCVRFGEEAVPEADRVVADYFSTSKTGVEEVVIDNPKAGVYFVNPLLHTTGRVVDGTVTATLSGASPATAQVQPTWKTTPEPVGGGEPVSPKPPVRAALSLGSDSVSLSSQPALTKTQRLKKLVPLTSLDQ